MADAKNRQAISERLRNRIKKASSSVSTKIEAEKGDFKVVLSSDAISHLYKNKEAYKLRVAQLDDELVEYINEDPQQAAHEILDEFQASFDPASTQVKEAAHSTQDDETAQMVTQKQLDEQKVKLHPRTDDYYTNVTQKQLPEHGQRPGTYEVITEAQFRDERDTFYGASRTSGDWKQEDRNIVTEGQLEKGTTEYSDLGQSDRGEMGATYDGGVEQQWKQIGEKQLMELLRHHEWTEPLTTTEGKDQLGKQDGELSRLTAETAEQIIKEALTALGSTVLAAGITPKHLADILNRLTSHESKYPALSNTIERYRQADVSTINKKIAKAQHFGKTANTSNDWSDFLVADVLVRQLGKIAFHPTHIVNALVAIATATDVNEKISKIADTILAGKTETQSPQDPINIFKDVLAGKNAKTEGDAKDGLYAYVGSLSEIDAPYSKDDQFAQKVAEYSKDRILAKTGQKIELSPLTMNVNEKDKTFEMVFKDINHVDDELTVRAQKRREMAKAAAQTTKTAQLGGGGAMPPTGGPQMGNPAPPPTGGDMGAAPPGEALSQEPPPAADGEESSGEPQQPGSICPACGSKDVDLDNGEGRCNHCGAAFDVSVQLNVKEWPDTIKETDEKEGKEGFGLEEGLGAEEENMAATGEGSGTTLPSVPVGTSARVTHRLLEKLAEQKIKLGSVCPSCGGNHTDLIKSISGKGYDGICWDCNQEYNFRVKASHDKKHHVYAQSMWRPNAENCDGCNRTHLLRHAFIEGLKTYGLSWNEFNNLSTQREQADTILKMAKSGVLNLKQAMQSPLNLHKFAASPQWKGYAKFDKFPASSCIERLSRRFGENASAMSGPCRGKKLADCVCGQLETLGIYSDGLAAKVAQVQVSSDPLLSNATESCISMFVREGYNLNDSCTVCDALRAAYASNEDLVIEAIAQINPVMPKPMAKPMLGKPMPKPMAAPTAGPMSTPGGPAKPMSVPGGPPKPMMGGTEEASPMLGEMPKPMDEPVITDEMEGPAMGMMDGMDGMMHGMDGMDGDMGMEGMDNGFSFGDEMGVGEEGNFVTLKLPMEDAQALHDALMSALQGDFGDEMIDTTGDQGFGEEPGMTDAITEGPVGTDGLGEDMGEGEDLDDVSEVTEGTVDDDDHDSDIPGLSDNQDLGNGDDIVKESEPESEDSEPEKEEKPDFGGEKSDDDSDDSKDMQMQNNPKKKMRQAASGQMVKEAQVQTDTNGSKLDDMLYSMKSGTIRTRNDALNSVFDGLIRQAKLAAKDNDVKKLDYKGADEGSKVKKTPAQDSTGFKFKDGGKMGHEESFSTNVKDTPDVPRKKQLLGDEGSEMGVDESKDLPTVPHGSSLMDGEEHYKPEKGNLVDGNQGGQKAASKSSVLKREANSNKKKENTMNKTKVWTVAQGQKYYDTFLKRAQTGQSEVKLTDGHTYDMTIDQNDNIILIAKDCSMPTKKKDMKKKDMGKDMGKNCEDSEKIKKESQSTNLNRVKSLVDDPDVNQGSGPGKGKTHADKPHSLGVDEKKPSEGMQEPSVPKAPGGGQLSREHTYDNKLDGPNIPAGGGMNSEYDQNEKNTPEKQDQVLGKENDLAAMAAKRDEAVKIAGQLLKANLITVDQLPSKINELSKATAEILVDYQNMLRTASDNKGMRKQAAADSVENLNVIPRTAPSKDNKSELKNNVQELFTLNKRNKDFERYSQELDERLYR